MELQLRELFPEFDKLHSQYGDTRVKPVYGAGCIAKPKLFLIFMNPTAKNISAMPEWRGIRAPWLGTKNIWKLFFKLELIDASLFSLVQTLRLHQWTPGLSTKLYTNLANRKVYVTNLAKCTQPDARPLTNGVFNAYLGLIRQEILKINPRHIITFGNQVSSVMLGKNIRISDYDGFPEKCVLENTSFNIHPVYYPVGQGMRNLNKAAGIINKILK